MVGSTFIDYYQGSIISGNKCTPEKTLVGLRIQSWYCRTNSQQTKHSQQLARRYVDKLKNSSADFLHSKHMKKSNMSNGNQADNDHPPDNPTLSISISTAMAAEKRPDSSALKSVEAERGNVGSIDNKAQTSGQADKNTSAAALPKSKATEEKFRKTVTPTPGRAEVVANRSVDISQGTGVGKGFSSQKIGQPPVGATMKTSSNSTGGGTTEFGRNVNDNVGYNSLANQNKDVPPLDSKVCFNKVIQTRTYETTGKEKGWELRGENISMDPPETTDNSQKYKRGGSPRTITATTIFKTPINLSKGTTVPGQGTEFKPISPHEDIIRPQSAVQQEVQETAQTPFGTSVFSCSTPAGMAGTLDLSVQNAYPNQGIKNNYDQQYSVMSYKMSSGESSDADDEIPNRRAGELKARLDQIKSTKPMTDGMPTSSGYNSGGPMGGFDHQKFRPSEEYVITGQPRSFTSNVQQPPRSQLGRSAICNTAIEPSSYGNPNMQDQQRPYSANYSDMKSPMNYNEQPRSYKTVRIPAITDNTHHMKSMVQVNQAIVEMVQAVSQYKQNVRAGPKGNIVPAIPQLTSNLGTSLEGTSAPTAGISLEGTPFAKTTNSNFVVNSINNRLEKIHGDVQNSGKEFPTRFDYSGRNMQRQNETCNYPQPNAGGSLPTSTNTSPERNQMVQASRRNRSAEGKSYRDKTPTRDGVPRSWGPPDIPTPKRKMAHQANLDSMADRAFEELQHKLLEISKELTSVKDENLSLRKQLENAWFTTDSTRDKLSKWAQKIEKYRAENFSLKDEVLQARRTLEESERIWQGQSGKWQQASMKVAQLTDIKDKLQKQLDVATKGSVAPIKRLEITDGQAPDSAVKLAKESSSVTKLETELNDTRKSKLSSEKDCTRYKSMADKAEVEIEALKKVNIALEQRLNDQRKIVSAEKSNAGLLNQDVSNAMKESEALRRELTNVNQTLENTRRSSTEIKTNLQSEENKVSSLEDKVKTHELELKMSAANFDDTKTKVEKCKKDNQELAKEVTELRQKLAEKEGTITQIKQDCSTAINNARTDSVTEKSVMSKEQNELEVQLTQARLNITELTDKLKQTKFELDTCSRAKSDLASEGAALKNADQSIARLQDELETARGKLINLEIEKNTTIEECKQAQDNHQKALAHITQLKDMLREHFEQYRNELGELRESLKEEVHQHEVERTSLASNLKKATAELRKKETMLASAVDTRMTMYDNSCHLEKTVEALRSQMLAEMNELQIVRQQNDSFKAELEDLRESQDELEQFNRELKASYTIVENDLNLEKDNFKRLNKELCDNKSERSKEEAHSLMLQTQQQAIMQRQKDKMFNLQDQMKSQCVQLQMFASSHAESEHCIAQFKMEKETLQIELIELQDAVAIKDKNLSQVQDQCTEALDQAQSDLISEKNFINKERDLIEMDLSKTKLELDEIKRVLKEKEVNLESLVNTHSNLEVERRLSRDAESHATQVEFQLAEARNAITQLELGVSRAKEKGKESQDSFETAQMQVFQMKDQLQTQRDQYTKKLEELQGSFNDKMSQHKNENTELSDQLDKTKEDLTEKRNSLTEISEMKAKMSDATQSLEHKIDGLNRLLADEVSGRRVSEQKNHLYKTQVKDLQSTRSGLDERYVSSQGHMLKLKAELTLERDKSHRLRESFSEKNSTCNSIEAHAHMIQTQLQSEVTSLQAQLECQKNNLQGQNKRLVLDLKQQTEAFDKERTKLAKQCEHLEIMRKKLASQNGENFLKLQEDALTMEERLRDASFSTKQVTDSLRFEEQRREIIESRYQELEQKYKQQIEVQVETSKLEGANASVTKRLNIIEKKFNEAEAKNHTYANMIAALEANLSQEQSMHMVTKTKLDSLDDDNRHLRKEFNVSRHKNSPNLNKCKSRMEKINDIIARDHRNAQQLMSTMSDNTNMNSDSELFPPITIQNRITVSDLSSNRSYSNGDVSCDIAYDINKVDS